MAGHRTHRLFLIASAITALLLAGCIGGATANVAFQGAGASDRDASVSCGGSGSLAIGVQGTGNVHVTVKDGDGTTIFDRTYSGSGQQGNVDDLSGAAGQWQLRARSTTGFSGQYGITLNC